MSTLTLCSTVDVIAALATVADPELDEPITDLEFVRSVELNDDGVEVHLRLPTAFCSPNFAYLMASDAVDALRTIEGIGRIRVLLDDHHDSEKINATSLRMQVTAAHSVPKQTRVSTSCGKHSNARHISRPSSVRLLRTSREQARGSTAFPRSPFAIFETKNTRWRCFGGELLSGSASALTVAYSLTKAVNRFRTKRSPSNSASRSLSESRSRGTHTSAVACSPPATAPPSLLSPVPHITDTRTRRP